MKCLLKLSTYEYYIFKTSLKYRLTACRVKCFAMQLFLAIVLSSIMSVVTNLQLRLKWFNTFNYSISYTYSTSK